MKAQLADPITDLNVLAERITNDLWWISQKVDGHRKIGLVAGGKAMALNRNGQPTSIPETVLKVLRTLPDCILDGELVDGMYHVFDLIEWTAEGITTATHYRQRQEALDGLSKGFYGHVQRLPVARDTETKFALVKRVIEHGGEGVMLNCVDGPYQQGPGRSRWVWKYKFRKDCDVHLTDRYVDGHDNFGMTVYTSEGEPVYVGEVTAQAGDGAILQVGDVATVTYLYAVHPHRPRLVQPTLPKKRTDKLPSECHVDQIIFTNKTVLA